MRKIFFIFSASILLLSACTTTSFNLGDDREYYSQSEKVCEKIEFTCAEGTELFSDKTGCGCEDIDEEKIVEEESGDKNGDKETTDEIAEDTAESDEDADAPEEESAESDEEIDEPEEDTAESDEDADAPEEEDDLDGPIIIDDVFLEPLDIIDIGDVTPDDIIDIQPQPIPIPIPDPLPQF